MNDITLAKNVMLWFELDRPPYEFCDFLTDTFNLCEIRQRAGSSKGVVFEVRSNEGNHHIPHVHASYDRHQISIAIETGDVLAGNLPSKQTHIAQKWVIEHKIDLLTKWNTFSIHGGSNYTKSALNSRL